jgi:serine/threonine-protein phosphatase CPPED1
MTKKVYKRRDFLKLSACGLAAFSMHSCMGGSILGPDSSFTFVQLCDPQLGFGGYDHDLGAFRQAVRQINAIRPDFVLICGDLVNTPDEKSFADFNRIRADISAPCYYAVGNHDAGNNPTIESLEYFRKLIGKDYYSFEHKGYTFVIINTQLWKAPIEKESEKQDAWIKTTLEGASRKGSQIFVVCHSPLFLDNPEEAEQYFNIPVEKRREVLTLFEKSGVVAVLGGHTHSLIVNNYKGIQMVNGETISKNFDNRPLGFRQWHVTELKQIRHDFVALEAF